MKTRNRIHLNLYLWIPYTGLLMVALILRGNATFAFLLVTWGLTLNNLLLTRTRPIPAWAERKNAGRSAATLLAIFALIALCPLPALALGMFALSEDLLRRLAEGAPATSSKGKGCPIWEP